MIKFLSNRVLPLFLVVLFVFSSLTISSSAAGVYGRDNLDFSSVNDWGTVFQDAKSNLSSSVMDRVFDLMLNCMRAANIPVSPFVGAPDTASLCWGMMDLLVASGPIGEQSYRYLDTALKRAQRLYTDTLRSTFKASLTTSNTLFTADDIQAGTPEMLVWQNLRLKDPCWMLRTDDNGYIRIYSETYSIYLVNSRGEYICTREQPTWTWINFQSASERVSKGSVNKLTADTLYLKQSEISQQTPCTVSRINQNWLCIRDNNARVVADASGYPYVAPSNEALFADNQERKPTEVKEVDPETGEVLNDVAESLEEVLEILNQPVGEIIYNNDSQNYTYCTFNYDNSTHEYTYNYYEYEYHVNYTSITYIGQTEEYNKYYEVYYELPDGRSSADLTAAELEQLNLSMDVIPYDRAADDARLRSLYHFDGDTRDSSYWNYCTSFDWDYGGSITYMDASTFGGALYLDEQPHGFTLTLPSELGTDDFTIQFRYYQSHTQAPVMDSYLSSGSTTLLGMTGQYFFPGSDTSVSPVWYTNVGTWNEIALIRSHGTLYYYVNGVMATSKALTAALTDELEFIFGGTQQTYKYLDELRVLSYALVPDGSNYTPTSVPYDTNLALVLPDGYIAVADEYWAVNLSEDATSAANFTAGDQLPAGFETSGLAISSGTNGMTFTPTSSGSWLRVPINSNDGYYGFALNFTLSSGDSARYIGVSRPNRGEFSSTLNSPHSSLSSRSIPELFFTGGSIQGSSNYIYVYLDQPVEVVALEWFVTSRCTSQYAAETALDAYSDAFSAGHESNVVLIEEGLDADLLAVKTDIPITGHQIGGVRPSLPVKGQVWALVESGYITSLQIYTGSAWEAVDGRIWTGSRWVPYSSYNVITLQDMYDIVDSSSNVHIYTESGFWDWWQRAWNDFVSYFKSIDFGGSGVGDTSESDLEYEVSEDDIQDWDFSNGEGMTLIEIVGGSVKGIYTFTKGMLKMVGNVFVNVPKAVHTISSAGNILNPSGAFGVFLP